jgi:hypothetical protein
VASVAWSRDLSIIVIQESVMPTYSTNPSADFEEVRREEVRVDHLHVWAVQWIVVNLFAEHVRLCALVPVRAMLLVGLLATVETTGVALKNAAVAVHVLELPRVERKFWGVVVATAPTERFVWRFNHFEIAHRRGAGGE